MTIGIGLEHKTGHSEECGHDRYHEYVVVPEEPEKATYPV